MLKYKRISLKLSGEAMGGAQAVDTSLEQR